MREFPGPAPDLIGLREKQSEPACQRDPWLKSRLDDEHRRNQIELVRERKICELRSQWEDQTREKLIEAETQRRFRAIKARERQEREKQRERLKQLLESEKKRLVSTRKSPEEENRERCEESRRRAIQLELERQEADRLKALEKYEQQFRDGCDILRSEMSRRRAYQVAEDIKVQIAMKQRQKKLEAEEDAWFAEMMKQRAENQKPSAANEHDTSRSLAEQLRKQILEKQQIEEQNKEMKQKEREDLLHLQLELEADRIRQLQIRMEKRAKIKEELDQCLLMRREQLNKDVEGIKSYEMILNREEDVKTVAEAKALEESKRRAHKETIQYLSYVQKSKKSAELFENQINKLIEEAVEREAGRVQEARRREKLARKSLVRQAAEFCLKQIQEKDEARQKAREENRKTGLEFNREIQRDKQKEKEHLEEHHRRLIQYRQALEDQIAYQQKMIAHSLEESNREQKAIREAESNLQNVIDEVVNSNLRDANRHPWRLQLALGHPGIPRWTGSNGTSTIEMRSQ